MSSSGRTPLSQGGGASSTLVIRSRSSFGPVASRRRPPAFNRILSGFDSHRVHQFNSSIAGGWSVSALGSYPWVSRFQLLPPQPTPVKPKGRGTGLIIPLTGFEHLNWYQRSRGGIGRRAGFRIRSPFGGRGSTPFGSTTPSWWNLADTPSSDGGAKLSSIPVRSWAGAPNARLTQFSLRRVLWSA